MKIQPLQRRTLALLAVLLPLAALLIFVALRSGPLAPVAVVAAKVESLPLRPALFGIGTVEARYVYRVGPTLPGRLKRLDVQVGDAVKAGHLLGEMDPVDLDDRIRSQEAAVKRAEAAQREASARRNYAETQAQRYQQLLAARATSEEIVAAKRQEQQVADAALTVAQEDMARSKSDLAALQAQRGNLRLLAPADGIISAREAEPGTSLAAGQAAVELIDPKSLWINVRFDQISAAGLAAGSPARIVLRSRSGQALEGRVLRVEPKADAVTEEVLAKLSFDAVPTPLPPIGELAEATVHLSALPASAVIPNAAVQRQGGQVGAWKIVDGKPEFVKLKLGRSDLDGHVQVLEGLKAGDRIVAYSEKALSPTSRLRVVEAIAGVPQ